MIDEAIRRMVENAVNKAREIMTSGEIPPPMADNRCEGCALINRCLPFEVKQLSGPKKIVTRRCRESIWEEYCMWINRAHHCIKKGNGYW
nr:Dna2/Cas4 domain-containing protein [Desulforamulus profundi]